MDMASKIRPTIRRGMPLVASSSIRLSRSTSPEKWLLEMLHGLYHLSGTVWFRNE
jgi:hypothetical protein